MIYRRGSIVGAFLLVGLGALFLYANLRELNPWPLVSRWWPLLLIFLGLGKLWDYFRQRSHPEATGVTGLTGGARASKSNRARLLRCARMPIRVREVRLAKPGPTPLTMSRGRNQAGLVPWGNTLAGCRSPLTFLSAHKRPLRMRFTSSMLLKLFAAAL